MSSYAVVHFIKDHDYSERPFSWLNNNNNRCWWPKVKNVSQYINRSMPPDPPTWDNYKEVEGVYATVQLARKKAEDSDCTSTEESVFRGKGKRRKRKKILISDDESSENYESERPPPSFISKENINKHQNIATFSALHDKVKDNVPLSSSTTNISDGQVLYIDVSRKENNKNIWNTSVSENNIGIESNSMHVQSEFQTEKVASSNETPLVLLQICTVKSNKKF